MSAPETSFLSKPWREMTSGELNFACAYWNYRIESATGWGASLAAADEFRREAEHELRRRGERL